MILADKEELHKDFILQACHEQGEEYDFPASKTGIDEKHLKAIDSLKASPSDAELLDIALCLGISMNQLLGKIFDEQMIGIGTKTVDDIAESEHPDGIENLTAGYADVSLTSGRHEYFPVSMHCMECINDRMKRKMPFCLAAGDNKYKYMNPKYVEEIRYIDLKNYNASAAGRRAAENCGVVNPALLNLAALLLQQCSVFSYNAISNIAYDGIIAAFCSEQAYSFLKEEMKMRKISMLSTFLIVGNGMHLAFKSGRTEDATYSPVSHSGIDGENGIASLVLTKEIIPSNITLSLRKADVNTGCLDSFLINLNTVTLFSFPISLGEECVAKLSR